MLTVIVMLTLAVVMVVVVVVWPAVEGWNAADAAKKSGKGAEPDATAAVPNPETLEGALVRQLLNNEINGRQYLHAMELLAERDADRHPLSMPPDS